MRYPTTVPEVPSMIQAVCLSLCLMLMVFACGNPHSDGIISPVPSPTGSSDDYGAAADAFGGGENKGPDTTGGGTETGVDVVSIADTTTGGGSGDADAAAESGDDIADAETDGAGGEDVKDDVAQDIAQDVAQDIAQDVAQDIAQDVIQDVGQDADEDVVEADGEQPPTDAGCVPNCAQKACGDDGCGGSCGDCGADMACYDGQCFAIFYYCALGCNSPKDCGLDPAPNAYDDSHYACNNGACEYLGCNNNTECTKAFDGVPAVCDDSLSVAPFCVTACNTPKDCVSSQPTEAFNADNYACEQGKCRYIGCHSTAECKATISADYGCDLAANLPTCKLKCNTPKDCAQPQAAYDADNYACINNYCEYTGCNNTAECAGLGPGKWVCTSLW